MKTLFGKLFFSILIGIFFSFQISYGQQWGGGEEIESDIYRIGRVGIGFDMEELGIYEQLEVEGGIRLGWTYNDAVLNGVLRWDENEKDFQGWNGEDWKSLIGYWDFSGNNIFTNTVGNVGIGTSNPLEKLEVSGGIKLGNTTNTGVGTIRWNGTKFEGRTSSGWNSLMGYWERGFGVDDIVYIGKVGLGNTTNAWAKLSIEVGDPIDPWDGGISLNVELPQFDNSRSYMIQSDEGFKMKSDYGYSFYDNTGANIRLRIDYNGNIGIGTTIPSQKLEVNGNIKVPLGSKIILGHESQAYVVGFEDGQDTEGLKFHTAQGDAMIIRWDKKVGIGTSNPTELLSVNGKIRSKEIIVNNTGWSDFVFEEDYNLRSLTEVETFIKENKHLPEIPTAKDVQENGVSLGEMQSKLLQKIEELTLYLIEQEKSIEQLKVENESLKEMLTQIN
jgi:hypothetical protein